MGSQRRYSSRKVQSTFPRESKAFKETVRRGDIDKASEIISSISIASTDAKELDAIFAAAFTAHDILSKKGVEGLRKAGEQAIIKRSPEGHLAFESLKTAEELTKSKFSPSDRKLVETSIENAFRKLTEKGGQDDEK